MRHLSLILVGRDNFLVDVNNGKQIHWDGFHIFLKLLFTVSGDLCGHVCCVSNILQEIRSQEDDTAPVFNGFRMIGYIGVQTLLLYWPVPVIAHFTGIERFELPTLKSLYTLAAITTLDGITTVMVLVCISISSPLFTL